jgi:histidinol-phosphate/aromatic aminotransferase/cobyric acid decarboxylase-like protein
MESALRITVGTPQENRRLVKALRKVLGKNAT